MSRTNAKIKLLAIATVTTDDYLELRPTAPAAMAAKFLTRYGSRIRAAMRLAGIAELIECLHEAEVDLATLDEISKLPLPERSYLGTEEEIKEQIADLRAVVPEDE
ncbi:MAG: hypothetical protein PHF37_10035 [Phycisphaerae bacterium]|nr:hypothetical protein [Phycisphaerae bacterium]